MARVLFDTEKRISPEFQKRLFDLISDFEITKQEFAEQVGLSKEIIARTTIYGIIPSVRTLIKIANFFDVSIPYLLAEDDEKTFYKSEKNDTFQNRLDELIRENQTKYSKIAKTMPFAANYFYEWKREGTLPSLEYLTMLADYFNVQIDYLLGRTDERTI